MTVNPTLPPQAQQDLRNRATADFIAVVGTCVEAMNAGVDLGEWVAQQSSDWTADHARMGVLVCGMLISATDVPVEALAAIGRALIHTTDAG